MTAAGDGYRIIVIDDDREMRDSLSHLLTAAKWHVDTLARAEDVTKRLGDAAPDAILCDVRMPGMTGLDLLRSLSGATAPPVVLISAHGDIPMAVEAMRDGAYSFLEKPFDPRRLLTVLRHAADQHRLTLDAARLKSRLARLSGLDRVLLGDTESIRSLREDVLDLSGTDAAVMLLGDTGTGKELVARALHDLSPRAAGPFEAINCAAIPVDHFEAAIFGVDGGAQGTLARADTGTLFLDEIGACPAAAQAKLLRVLETREFTPLGAARTQKVDIRVVSASNEDTDAAVADGRLREDLFYRLNTVMLTLPPLKERRDDVLLLYAKFLR